MGDKSGGSDPQNAHVSEPNLYQDNVSYDEFKVLIECKKFAGTSGMKPYLSKYKVWFQNRRAKWKKRKKSTNVFRTPGALLPSHGLPPFGSMSDGLCGSSMFGTPSDTRWGVSGMSAAGLSQLSQNSAMSMSSHLSQFSSTSHHQSNLSSSMTSGAPGTLYQSHYGLNSLDPVFYGHDTGGSNSETLN